MNQNMNVSFPINGDQMVMTSPFGWRLHPVSHDWKMHKGTDFSMPVGTSLFSTENGTVVSVDEIGKGVAGKSITLEYDREDGSKVRVKYLHLDSVSVQKGDVVTAGQEVAKSGKTGIGTGAHLHMSVLVASNGAGFEHKDPMEYLAWLESNSLKNLAVVKAGETKEDLLSKYSDNDVAYYSAPATMPKQKTDSVKPQPEQDILIANETKPSKPKLKDMDVTSLMASAESAKIDINKNGLVTLSYAYESDEAMRSVQLKNAEVRNLKSILFSKNLNDEEKKASISGILAGAAGRCDAMRNFNAALENLAENQSFTLRV